MDQGPLVIQQIEAGERLAHEFSTKHKPLQAVFWLKESEDGQWFLYLASDQIDDSNFDEAYREVHRLLGRGPHTWLDPFQIKVTGIGAPPAKTVLDLLRKYPGQMPARFPGRPFSGQGVEEAYIYPIPVPASA